MPGEVKRKRGWKKLLQERAREILNQLPLGAVQDEESIDFLDALIAMHPEADVKIGVGVHQFVIRPSTVNPWQRTFWIVRQDGTETDFSYRKCITPPSPLQDFKRACRTAVKPSVLAFKARVFEAGPIVLCPITGDALTIDEAHVDHASPWTFDRIAMEFLGDRDPSVMVRPTEDGSCITEFSDSEIALEFCAFHDERACLRLVSRRANLSLLTRKESSGRDTP